MRNPLGALALLAITVLAAGCKKADPIVGKWSASANGGSLNFEFKPDSTFTMAAQGGAMSLTFKGDYKLAGDTLSLTVKDVEPPSWKGLMEKDPNFGKPTDMKATFASDDELSIGPANGAAKPGGTPLAAGNMTLQRVKS